MAARKPLGISSSLAQLYKLIEPRERREVWMIVLLTIVGALGEVVTIGAVIPFLALLANSHAVQHLRWIQRIFDAVGADTRQSDLVAATTLLCVAAVSAGFLRVLLVRKTQDFVFGFGHRLSVEIQRRTLLQPYSWQVRHNSSEQLAAIEKVHLVTYGVLLPLVQACASIVLIGFVVAVLLEIAPVATFAAALVLGAIYYLLGALTRRRLESYSDRIDTAFERRIRILQEGLGGIREIILDGSQASVLEQFRRVDLQLARAMANATFVSTIPRFIVEPAGIIVIAGLALLLSGRSGGLVAALPILGALALGAQRLLPIVQQLYNGWTTVAANRSVIEDVVRRGQLAVRADAPAGPRLAFERSVEFRDVSFAYADRPDPAVAGLTFSINAGTRVALVGPTGSGKSTTADLLMGLLEPAEGSILVDSVPLTDANRQAWRANVAHVPQTLFLADATIAANIAFGSELDMVRVRKASSLAQLDPFVEALPHGLDTIVGERGVRISGGQRQRLALARAIYRETPLLVLDEATSALDDETEAAVLRTADRLQEQGRTILIIAHRSKLIGSCDQVVRLEKGRITAISSGADGPR